MNYLWHLMRDALFSYIQLVSKMTSHFLCLEPPSNLINDVRAERTLPTAKALDSKHSRCQGA